jgi:hypothetical protein
MTWILPTKKLMRLASSPDTEDLKQASERRSQTLESSLTWNGKLTQSRYWLKKLKTVYWMKRLFGLMSLPSQQKSFEEKYISSLPDTRAKILVVPEKERVWEGIEEKCGDSQGQCLMDVMLPPLLEKTFSDTSRLDSTPLSATWQRMVSALREEYKALQLWDSHILGSEYFLSRSKQMLGSGESGSLMNSSKLAEDQTENTSYATPQARDWKGPQGRSFKGEAMDLPAMTEQGWSENKLESHAKKETEKEEMKAGQMEMGLDFEETPPGMFPTPRVADKTGSIDSVAEVTPGGFRSTRDKSGLTFGAMLGQAVGAMDEKEKENWSTPCVGDTANEPLDAWEKRRKKKESDGINLHRKLDIQVRAISESKSELASQSQDCSMKDSPQPSITKESHTSTSEQMWGTPNTMDHLPSRSYEAAKEAAQAGQRKNRSKPSNLREQIDPLMCQAYQDAKKEANNWSTPNTMDHLPPKEGEALERNKKKGGCKNLREDVNSSQCEQSPDPESPNMIGKPQESQKRVLNPNWVESLMMLPKGYTLIKYDKTDLDCAEME